MFHSKLLTCKTKEDLLKDDVNLVKNQEFFDNNEDYIQINYYLLKLLKCKYDGEVDTSMQYLKLISIAQLNRDSVMNFSNVGSFLLEPLNLQISEIFLFKSLM